MLKTVKERTCNFVNTKESADGQKRRRLKRRIAMAGISLRKQPTFRDATTGFPAK